MNFRSRFPLLLKFIKLPCKRRKDSIVPLANTLQRRSRNKRLIVFVYEYNHSSVLFSHQYRVIAKLSEFYEQIIVVPYYCQNVTDLNSMNRVRVIDLELEAASWIVKSLKLCKFILRFRKDSELFAFMTDSMSAAVALVTRIFGIRHFLWYAHAHNSIYLLWSRIWVNRIFTSTSDSISVHSKKIRFLGQMVDAKVFQNHLDRDFNKCENAIFVGRIDPTKKLDLILSSVVSTPCDKRVKKVVVIGEPSSENSEYMRKLKRDFSIPINSGIIEFEGNKNSVEITEYVMRSDFFVHAFEGSLDKVLVEACLLGIPIVSSNIGFLREFGSFKQLANSSGINVTEIPNLFLLELNAYLDADAALRRKLTEHRRSIAIKKHTLDNWVDSFISEVSQY